MKLLVSLLASVATAATLRSAHEAKHLSAESVSVMKPDQLEDTLLGLLDEGNTPALKPFLATISRVVENQMYPALVDSRNRIQTELTRTVKIFDTCTTGLSRSVAAAAKLHKQALQVAAAHQTCLSQYTSLKQAADDCQTQLDAEIARQKAACDHQADIERSGMPSCAPGAQEDVGDYALRMLQTFNSADKTYLAAVDTCKKAGVNVAPLRKQCALKAALARDKKANCDANTPGPVVCSWKNTQSTGCKSYDSCYSTAKKSFQKTLREYDLQEEGLRTEFEGIQRLRCLVKVFAVDDLGRREAITECRRSEHDTDAMALRRPKAPAEELCNAPTAAELETCNIAPVTQRTTTKATTTTRATTTTGATTKPTTRATTKRTTTRATTKRTTTRATTKRTTTTTKATTKRTTTTTKATTKATTTTKMTTKKLPPAPTTKTPPRRPAQPTQPPLTDAQKRAVLLAQQAQEKAEAEKLKKLAQQAAALKAKQEAEKAKAAKAAADAAAARLVAQKKQQEAARKAAADKAAAEARALAAAKVRAAAEAAAAAAEKAAALKRAAERARKEAEARDAPARKAAAEAAERARVRAAQEAAARNAKALADAQAKARKEAAEKAAAEAAAAKLVARKRAEEAARQAAAERAAAAARALAAAKVRAAAEAADRAAEKAAAMRRAAQREREEAETRAERARAEAARKAAAQAAERARVKEAQEDAARVARAKAEAKAKAEKAAAAKAAADAAAAKLVARKKAEEAARKAAAERAAAEARALAAAKARAAAEAAAAAAQRAAALRRAAEQARMEAQARAERARAEAARRAAAEAAERARVKAAQEAAARAARALAEARAKAAREAAERAAAAAARAAAERAALVARERAAAEAAARAREQNIMNRLLNAMGPQSTCDFNGDPHFNGLDRVRMDYGDIGYYWLVHNEYIGIQGLWGRGYWHLGSTHGIALGGWFLQRNSLVLDTSYQVKWNGRVVGVPFKNDLVTVTRSGNTYYVTAPLNVRVTFDPNQRWGTINMRLPPGQSWAGACYKARSGNIKVAGTGFFSGKGFMQLGANEESQDSDMEGAAPKLLVPACKGEQLAKATEQCKAALGKDISKARLNGCIVDMCDPGGSPKDSLKFAANILKTQRAEVAKGIPLKFVVVKRGQRCPAKTVKAVPHAKDEKRAIRIIKKAGSKVCVPKRLYRTSGLADSVLMTRACSTGEDAMQLAQPRSEGEQRRASALVKKQGGGMRLWLGGKFNAETDSWEWQDGTPITEWPSDPLTSDDAAEGTKLCMLCEEGAACSWVACGGTKAEEHVALCESQIEP